MASGYLVQRQLVSRDVNGKKRPANSDEWQTVSGYGRKESAIKEAQYLRSRHKNYRFRVVAHD